MNIDKEKARIIAGTAANAAEVTVGGTLRLIFRIIFTALLVFIITGLLFACIFAYYVKTELDSQLKVTLEEARVTLSSTIWYTDGQGQNHELLTLSTPETRIWVDYENLPEGMEHALVAIEDKRFYKHKGVDWYRTAGAFVQMFLSMRNDFGGSTLTQQLIKNNTGNDADLVSRKLMEIFQALELEKTYTKEEIVEWYLNLVYFGQGCNGVYTAAQKYFGKDVWDLSLAESASIIGITNNPSKYDPFIANVITDRDLGLTMSCREWNKYRQELILYEMYDQGYISYDEYQEAKNEELQFVRSEEEAYVQEVRSYYVETLIEDVIADLMEEYDINKDRAYERLNYGGLQIYACIDPEIQKIVDSVYENVDALPQPYRQMNKQLQSAIVLMDPYTGEIKALSGGVGEKTGNLELNRATQSKRPAGSSIKPLSVYGPALEYGLITQNTLVNDAPGIQLKGTWWYPHNTPSGYDYIITIRTALAKSKNTVAAQIVDKLGPAECLKYLRNKLGFTSPVDSDADYAAMALGQFNYGVTVREMAQAYCSFVNDGILTKSRTYTKVLDSKGNVVLDNQPETSIAFSPNTAANICNMLENAATVGTGSAASFPGMSVAGKTGTTSADMDRWFCGFTPYYVAAVWTGYDMPEAMPFYGNPAITIWRTIMEQVHVGLENKSFPTPMIGQALNTFGDLSEAYAEQEYRKQHPDEPVESDEPQPSDEPTPSDTPSVTDPVIGGGTETDPPATTEPVPSATIEPQAPSVTDPAPDTMP